MKYTKLALMAAALFILASAATAEKPLTISIWPDGAPLGDGKTEPAEVPITLHLPPADKATGAALIICPGGGYGGQVMDGEGHGIARWLNSHGIAGIVLKYRLPHGRARVPMLDAQRAIRLVRSRAPEWKINPDRIGIIGFSAGGHLASTAATHFDAGDSAATDPIQRISCRPDFAVLIYPVISMGDQGHMGSRNNLMGPNPSPDLVEYFSSEKQVTPQTPPVFLAHAKTDSAVPVENARMFYQAMKAKGVKTEYLEFPQGTHGFSGYKGPEWNAWQKACIAWIAGL